MDEVRMLVGGAERKIKIDQTFEGDRKQIFCGGGVALGMATDIHSFTDMVL